MTLSLKNIVDKFLSSKKTIFFAVKALIAILVIIVLIKKISLQDISAAIEQARLRYVAIAFALLGLNLFFQFKKWQYMVRLEKPTATAKEIFLSLLTAYPLGFITPGRIGEFGKAFFIKQANWPGLLGLALIEKIFSLSMIYFAGILSLTYFIKLRMNELVYGPVLITGIVMILVIAFLLMRPDLMSAVLRLFTTSVKQRKKLYQLFLGLEKFSRDKAPGLLFLVVCHFLTYMSQFCLLAKAFAPISFPKAFVAVSAIMFVKTLLPISLGDLGVRESAAIFFFSVFDYPASAAFNASLLLFLINLFLPSMAGLLFILKRRLTNHSN